MCLWDLRLDVLNSCHFFVTELHERILGHLEKSEKNTKNFLKWKNFQPRGN